MNKFSEAFSLLFQNIGLFSAIILTVWLPGNIATNYVVFFVEGGEDIGLFRMPMWIEGIFGPVYIGALMYALNRIKHGQDVSYGEAMGVGVSNWGKLFGARFVAGLITMLGALLLIVQGVIMAVRFALLAPAVILEGQDASGARARSTELTVGKRWAIFGSAVLFFICFMIFSSVIYIPSMFIAPLNTIGMNIILDCVIDVAYSIIQIVMFLFFWEATQPAPEPPPPVEEPERFIPGQ